MKNFFFGGKRQGGKEEKRAEPITGDSTVYLTGDERVDSAKIKTLLDTMAELISSQDPVSLLESIVDHRSSRSVIGLIGYAGWAPFQLEQEIGAGAWLPTDVEPSLVFDVPTEEAWQRAYEHIGASPIAFTAKTVGSA